MERRFPSVGQQQQADDLQGLGDGDDADRVGRVVGGRRHRAVVPKYGRDVE